MKYTNKIGMMVVAGTMLATTSCTDFSDYNTAEDSTIATASKTLWENIDENKDLSEFASVLQRVGYDKVFDESHTYTIWAPVNGTFNADSLNKLSDEKIVNEFIKNHAAEFSHLESDINDTTIYMLSKKFAQFTGKNTKNLTFAGNKVVSNGSVYNMPCNNGILYAINGTSPFKFNGYESILAQDDIAKNYMEFVKKYENRELDVKASVKGEIINGVQHYDDSVITITNKYLHDPDKVKENKDMLRARLDLEDSLYTIIIPNDEAWEKTYAKIKKYYNYIPTISYQNLADPALVNQKGSSDPTNNKAIILSSNFAKKDENLAAAPAGAAIKDPAPYRQDSIIKRMMTNYLAFSHSNTKYNSKFVTDEAFVEKDTIVTTNNKKLSNPTLLDEVTVKKVTLSNGNARIVNDFPYSAEDTYLPTIRTRQVGRIFTAKGQSFERLSIPRRMLNPKMVTLDEPDEEFTYVKTPLQSSNIAPELDFYIPNVRSATYDIFLVVVPACIEDEEVAKLPYTLRVDINFTNEKNEQLAGRFNGDTIIYAKDVAKMKVVEPFIVGAEKVDTVKLGRLHFPICYAESGTDAAPNIKVMHTLNTFSNANKKNYTQELRIANIILRPVDENATKED